MSSLIILGVVLYACMCSASVSARNATYFAESEVFGVDISVQIDTDTAACLLSKGISFVIPRAYRSIGEIDSQACPSLEAAKAAGIAQRDAYIFPCPTCTDLPANDQMSTMVDYLTATCREAWSGRAWLDIEGSQYWTGDFGMNMLWFEQLVDSCIATSPAGCGVYASLNSWVAIFGSETYAYAPASGLPLWYPHYDDSQSFDDWKAYGGWSQPVAKQYLGDTKLCEVDVDMNWAPVVF